MPGGFIDFFFFFEPLSQDIDDGQTDRVAILDKLHFVDGGESFCNLVREQVDLFAG